MVAGQANNATHVRSTKGTFSFSTKGGGKEPSHRRPGTASTVDSFTSALNSPSQVKADLPTPRSSISSTSYGHFDQASRERRFEDMLASGETRRLSETHERDSKNKKLAGRSTAFKVDRREGEASPRRKQGEVLERGQGVLGEEQRESLEEEGDDDEDDYGADEASMAREAAYSPSRLASALSRQTGPGTPRKRLPVHPLSRPGSGQGSETAGTSAASAGHNSTSSARNGGRPSSRGSLGLTPTLDSRVFPSPSPSYTSEFTITSVNSDRSSRGQSTLAAANSLPDSELGRSQATITVAEILKDPQTSEQLHIDKGTNSSSAALSEKSGSALRQRIRKTGGFLKRLGGGNSTDKSRLTPPAGSKVMRKSSQSSLFSESGFSIANSTKSAPGDDNQSRWEQGSSSVPVPSIPTKFKSSNSINQFTIQRAEGKSGASIAGSKARDSPATIKGKHTTSASLDGSVGSTTTDMKHVLEAWEQEMDATLQQSGQDLASKTRVTIPPRNWTPSPQLPPYKVLNRQKSFMEEGNDPMEQREVLNSGTSGDSSVPSGDSKLQHGSLAQHGNKYLSPTAQSQTKPQRSASLGLGLPSVASLKLGSTASLKLGSTADSLNSPTRLPNHSQSVSSDESSRYRKNRSRDEDASYASYASFTSAKSFQTAVDRPSFFVRHGRQEEEREEASDAAAEKPRRRVTDSRYEMIGKEDLEPEKSIRLISGTSGEAEEEIMSSSHLHQASASQSIGDSSLRVGSSAHAKDGTVTQNDYLRREPAIAEVAKADSPGPKGSEEEEDALAKELAKKCWSEDETFKRKEKIAEWLGGYASVNRSACRFYMDFFDFTTLRIDMAFRKLCDKLFLRAETQQIDRILSAFGQRYFNCNPTSKSLLLNADMVHALVFSILLLNTDLHVAEMQDRMTRSQFVRNTLAAMVEGSGELHASKTVTDYPIGQRTSFSYSSENADEGQGPATEQSQTSKSLAPAVLRKSFDAASLNSADIPRTPSQSAHAPFGRVWEAEMESLLKDVYQAIKNDQIRLPIGEVDTVHALRAPRTLRAGSDRVNALKRGSIRGIQGLLGSNPSYARPEESPTVSRTSLNSTQRSQSDSLTGVSTPSTSLVSTSSHGVPLSLGFANTLSQSIIKEAKDEDDSASLNSANDDPTDDELALMGPPWAKEGILTRKHYWESPHRRAKDKSWTNCFVVVQRGVFSMFKFGEGANSSSGQVAAVGGGNWMSNATCIGEFSLAHTVANALPPPGYNRTRPHVFALTLPDGCVYFYQTGHEDLLQEWVSTCNYWAARQSKEPLAGGVSNMEYGWNRVMPNDNDSVSGEDDGGFGITSTTESSRPSMNNANSDTRSIRSGKSSKSVRLRAAGSSLLHSRGGGVGGQEGKQTPALPYAASGTTSPRPSSMRGPAGFILPLERPAYINEWRAPAPPTVSSNLNEEDQLEACIRYKARVEAELAEHSALRQPLLAYLDSIKPTTSNANVAKAIANFDRKESYLLSDLSKFTLYKATLSSANKLKAEKRDARSLNRMIRKADEEVTMVREGEE